MKNSSTNLYVGTIVFCALLVIIYMAITPTNPVVAPNISSTGQSSATTQKQSPTPICDTDTCGMCTEGKVKQLD